MEFNKKHILNSIPKIFEILRTVFSGIGFYVAYVYYFKNEYVIALHMLIIFVVIPLSGLTGMESVFFSEESAKAKGRITGSPYQIQSGLNNMAVTITAMIGLIFIWGLYAELTTLFIILIFFSTSAINHAVEFFKHGNKKMIHLMRLLFSLLLVLGSLPIIIGVLLKSIPT